MALFELKFVPMGLEHLCHINDWFQHAHVRDRWDTDLSVEEILADFADMTTLDYEKPFIIYCDNKPIGYIQCYFCSKVGNGWWENYDDDIAGIDYFIGNPFYLNKGLGTQILKDFTLFLFQKFRISKIIADPKPDNQRVIACALKAGFKVSGKILTPDGEALLMELKK